MPRKDWRTTPERSCIDCGKMFKGSGNHRCPSCNRIYLTCERNCVTCGSHYIGNLNQCLTCRRPKQEKVCIDCKLVSISARKSRCSTCEEKHKSRDKFCTVCGEQHRNSTVRCGGCEYQFQAKDLTCVICSKEFRGILRKGKTALCNACYRPEKTKKKAIKRQQMKRETITSICQICSKEFRGQGTRCAACYSQSRVAERICDNCGKTYYRDLARGRVSLCTACRLTPKQREARVDRVRKKQALMKGASVVEDFISWKTLWAQGLRHCAYCGIECDPTDKLYGHIGPTSPTLDHVIPLVLGGAHARSNAVLACFTCNARKNDKTEYTPRGQDHDRNP